MILLKLLVVFAKIGLFAFGGAYSFLPLMEREVVETRQWLDKTQFLEAVGMAKMFPGANSIKLATYTGYKVAGVPGAVVAVVFLLFTFTRVHPAAIIVGVGTVGAILH
jgi:chromate transporter